MILYGWRRLRSLTERLSVKNHVLASLAATMVALAVLAGCTTGVAPVPSPEPSPIVSAVSSSPEATELSPEEAGHIEAKKQYANSPARAEKFADYRTAKALLAKAVMNGEFGSKLFYRISPVPIWTPGSSLPAFVKVNPEYMEGYTYDGTKPSVTIKGFVDQDGTLQDVKGFAFRFATDDEEVLVYDTITSGRNATPTGYDLYVNFGERATCIEKCNVGGSGTMTAADMEALDEAALAAINSQMTAWRGKGWRTS